MKNKWCCCNKCCYGAFRSWYLMFILRMKVRVLLEWSIPKILHQGVKFTKEYACDDSSLLSTGLTSKMGALSKNTNVNLGSLVIHWCLLALNSSTCICFLWTMDQKKRLIGKASYVALCELRWPSFQLVMHNASLCMLVNVGVLLFRHLLFSFLSKSRLYSFLQCFLPPAVLFAVSRASKRVDVKNV